jgi:hypothetical protein
VRKSTTRGGRIIVSGKEKLREKIVTKKKGQGDLEIGPRAEFLWELALPRVKEGPQPRDC